MTTIEIDYKPNELAGTFKILNEELKLITGTFEACSIPNERDLITFKRDDEFYPAKFGVRFNKYKNDIKKEIEYFLHQQYIIG